MVFLIIGVLLQLSCAFNWFSLTIGSSGYRLLEQAANIILVSSLVSFLLNSIRYIGFFQEELEKIIYGESFLAQRKDIERVWRNVSNAFFKAKFPEIQEPLMLALKDYGSPDNDDYSKLSYYHNYRTIYHIDDDEEHPGMIAVKDESQFTLKVEDKGKFTFPLKFWTCTTDDNRDEIEQVLSLIQVNGKDVTPEEHEPTYDEDTRMMLYHYSIPLENETEYKIKYITNSKQRLTDDNYLAFRARWLVKDMRVQIRYPNNYNVLFVNRAVSGGFTLNNVDDSFQEYEHQGVILKHQGYVIILIKKE